MIGTCRKNNKTSEDLNRKTVIKKMLYAKIENYL